MSRKEKERKHIRRERERERVEREKTVGENGYNKNNFHNFIPTLTLKKEEADSDTVQTLWRLAGWTVYESGVWQAGLPDSFGSEVEYISMHHTC